MLNFRINRVLVPKLARHSVALKAAELRMQNPSPNFWTLLQLTAPLFLCSVNTSSDRCVVKIINDVKIIERRGMFRQ